MKISHYRVETTKNSIFRRDKRAHVHFQGHSSSMADPSDELEPLFDYSRVHPIDIVNLDDDLLDESPVFLKKRRKFSASNVEKKVVDEKPTEVIVCDDDKDEDDWLPPPPKISDDTTKLDENSALKELRLKKKELASFAQSALDDLRDVEETVQRDFSASLQSATETLPGQPPKPSRERDKIVISIQDKDEQKQFRVYKNDKFERLFKMYADKVKLDAQKLVFCFDGDKISPTQTPEDLGMEDDDMIEVRTKSH